MSNSMVWDDSLNTGIEIIDNQHKGILEYIIKLDTASRSGDKNVVSEVLAGLANYTISHFAFEEDLQAQNGYPLAVPHKKVHEHFLSQVVEYQRKHDAGEDIARKLSGELMLWLRNHIKNEDQDYVPYCNKPVEKGLLGRMLGKYFR